MGWRLGLDMGTNSLGWAAVELDGGKPAKLLDLGVRIFSDGRAPGRGERMGDPLAVERRMARGARRLRERRWRRIRSMHALMVASKFLDQADLGKNRTWKELNPYELRSAALDRSLSGEELARVLTQMARRRGFQSNRKDSGKSEDAEKEQGIIKGQTKALEAALGNLTLGQFLWKAAQGKHGLRFKKGVSEFYPSRLMYKEEFQRIRDFQAPNHPNFDWDAVERILFFQRPLRPVERGKCTFYKEEFRAFKHQPSSHRYRIVQELLNLKKMGPVEQLPLTRPEFDKLFAILDTKEKLTFHQIRKELNTHDSFNLESENRTELLGNATAVKVRRLIGSRWDKFNWEEQDTIAEILIGAEDAQIIELLLEKGLTETEAKALLPYTPANGTTSVSARFQRDCTRLMIDGPFSYSEATLKLGFHHSKVDDKELLERLPYYGEILKESVMGAKPDKIPKDCKNTGIIEELTHGKINNPTVHIALRQTQRLVNRLIDRFGPPEEIVLELARELKMGPKKIDEVIKKQAENQKVRAAGKVQFEEMKIPGAMSDQDHKKYRLWKELEKGQNNHQCLYCGKVIGGHSLFSQDTEIEHILPFSRTLDNSFGNLTLAHRACNQFKGNKTPFEAFGNSPVGYQWNDILARAKAVGKERKFHPTAMEALEKKGDFLTRQLSDTAYMTRITLQYLSCVTSSNKIWSSPGQMTAQLRAKWGYNTLLNRGQEWHKNRSDHRHHAVDALVIALSDRGLLQEVAKLNGQNRSFEHVMPPCPIDRTTVEDRLKTVLVSHKLDHGFEGKLYKETALGKVKTLAKVNLKDPKDLDSLEEHELNTIRPVKIREYIVSWAANYRNEKKNSTMWFPGFKKALAEKYDHLVVRRERFAARAPITEWKTWKQIESRWTDGFQIKKFREYLETRNIFSPETLKEKDLQAHLQQYSEQEGIRHIRCIPNDESDKTDIPSAPFKFYSVMDYLCVDIWATPKKGNQPKYSGIFVSRVEAYKNKYVRTKPDFCKKPHPAAKYILRLYKGDIFYTEYNGNMVIGLIKGFKAQENKIDFQSIYNSASITDWIEDTNNKLLHAGWEVKKSTQNYVSINVLFSHSESKLIKITEDGRWTNR